MNTYEIIQELCKKNDTTVSKLCEELTKSKGNLQTWKKNNMNQGIIKKIANYFNVSTDYLLLGKEYVSPLQEAFDALSQTGKETVLTAFKLAYELDNLTLPIEFEQKISKNMNE